MSNHSLRTQTAYNFAGKGVAYVISLASPIILVRMMDPEEFGTYRQILFLYVVVSELMRLAIPQSLYYFFPRTGGKRNTLLSQTLLLLVAGGLGIGLLFIVCCGWFKWLPSGLGTEFVLPMAVYFFADSVAFLLEPLFIVEAKPLYTFLNSVATAALLLLAVIGSLFVFKSLLGIMAGLIAFSSLRLLVLLVYLLKKYGIRFGVFDTTLLRAQLRYILPLVGSTVIGMIGAQVDRGVVSAIMSPYQFAVYSLGGLGIVSAVTLFSVSMGNVCLPRLSELAMHGNKEGMRQLWHKMILLNATLILPTICFCYVFAREIVTVLYTERYVASAGILKINLFILPMMLSEYGRIPTAMGRTTVIFRANATRSAVGLLLVFWMVMRFGMAGAAVSAVAAYWVNGLLQLYDVKRTLGIGIGDLLPWRKLGVMLAVSIAGAIVLPHIARLGMPNIWILAMAPLYAGAVMLALQAVGCIDVIGNLKTLVPK